MWKANCLYKIIHCKTSSKTRLVQYIITAKNVFKTSIYALEVMLSTFKNPVPLDFSLLALQPYVRPTSHRSMGQVFLTMQVIAV